MPEKTPTTKAGKKRAVEQVMHEFKHGQLRSGSPAGPKVTSPAQAKAIAMSEAGMSKGKKGKRKKK
jgi:hypothetical protein